MTPEAEGLTEVLSSIQRLESALARVRNPYHHVMAGLYLLLEVLAPRH
jgi:hypothetical protein